MQQDWMTYIAAVTLVVVFGPGLSTAQSQDNQDPSLIGASAEKKFTIQLDAPEQRQYCQASAAVEYIQMNTIASYSGQIVNEDCSASGGTYILSVRYRDEDGEVHRIESEESWQREGDLPYKLSGEVAIGENVDLMSVRARKLQCVCSGTPAAEEKENKGGNE